MTTTPSAPTLTAYTDADPCPRVEILVTPMAGDIDQITVYRTWRGQRSAVRGALRAEVAGPFLIVDYEVPLGTSVSYTAVGYDVAGTASVESAATTVTVNVDDVWIQDPLDPTSAIQVGLTKPRSVMAVHPSFMPATSPMAMTINPVAGSPLPIALGGMRQAASGIPLTIVTSTPEESTQLAEMLDQAFPVCVRTPGEIYQLSGLTYMAIQDVTPDPHRGWERSTFALVGTSVRGPGVNTVIQPRTYADLPDEAATYTALKALYATYVDVKRGL